MQLGIPKTAVIGAIATWITILPGYPSATFDLIWLLGTQTINGTAQTLPGTGWETSTNFDWGALGPCAWTLSVRHKSTLVITEIATGSIFVETPEYNTLRLQAEAAAAAILKILQGGGNQSLSIKGRSSSKYSLSDLRGIEGAARAKMARLLAPGGAGSQLLARF